MSDEVTGTAILHEETLRELGLSEQPFVDGKKPHRFTDSALQKTRASLEQHTRFGESVHLLLGDTGAGKTVLLSQLIKHCKNSIKPFVAKGSDGFVADAFLAAVLNQLGGEQCEDMSELVDALAPEFAALNDDQFSVLLAIDDAHLAPVEEIAELVNVMSEFNNDGEISARLLLTGEAKLKSSLDALAREYDGMTFEPSVSTLAPLTEPQMRDYLSSRLNHAGHTDVFPFTEKALAKIHRESGGLPAAVNTGSAHYLNTVYANASAGKAGGGLFAALGWPVLALGTAAVGLIAWGLSMFIGGDEPDQVVTVKPPTIVANAPVEIKLVEDDADADGTNESGEDLNNAIKDLASTDLQSDQTSSGSLLQLPDADSDASPDDTAATIDTDAAADTAEETSAQAAEQATAKLVDETVAQAADSVSQTTEQLNESVQNAADSAAGDAADSAASNAEALVSNTESQAESVASETEQTADAAKQQVAETAQATEQVISDSNESANTSEPTEMVIASSDSNTGAVSGTAAETRRNNGVAITTTQPIVAESEAVDISELQEDTDALSDNNDGVAVPVPSVEAEPSAPPRAVENERWVLFQEPTHFTVQLATSRERNYILELAQGLTESPVAIYPFKTTESQNPVFGLLSGLYETRSEAINAVENMSNDVKRFGVWIRPISDLQADIKRNQ